MRGSRPGPAGVAPPPPVPGCEGESPPGCPAEPPRPTITGHVPGSPLSQPPAPPPPAATIRRVDGLGAPFAQEAAIREHVRMSLAPPPPEPPIRNVGRGPLPPPLNPPGGPVGAPPTSTYSVAPGVIAEPDPTARSPVTIPPPPPGTEKFGGDVFVAAAIGADELHLQTRHPSRNRVRLLSAGGGERHRCQRSRSRTRCGVSGSRLSRGDWDQRHRDDHDAATDRRTGPAAHSHSSPLVVDLRGHDDRSSRGTTGSTIEAHARAPVTPRFSADRNRKPACESRQCIASTVACTDRRSRTVSVYSRRRSAAASDSTQHRPSRGDPSSADARSPRVISRPTTPTGRSSPHTSRSRRASR